MRIILEDIFNFSAVKISVVGEGEGNTDRFRKNNKVDTLKKKNILSFTRLFPCFS